MKRFTVPAAILFILLVFSACSDFTVTFDNVTNNRSSDNSYEGIWSYTDDCIYRSLDDGLYEYDIENETIVKIADYGSIEGITAMLPFFSVIPEGFVIISNQFFDIGNMKYDKKTDTYTAELNMYVVNYKGEVKKTITLENTYDENNQSIDESRIDYFTSGFMIDNGWIYGQNNAGWLRYDIDTGETQHVCENLLCIAGEYIYCIEYEDVNILHRIKENDLSGEETMSFGLTNLMKPEASYPEYGDEAAANICVFSDGTVIFSRQEFGNDPSDGRDAWQTKEWYSCKFGEEPQVIGDGYIGYDVSYADGYFYAVSKDKNPDSSPDEFGNIHPYLDSGKIYKISSETFEQELIYSGEMGYPVMIGEKYLVISYDTDSAAVYAAETGETVYLEK